MLFSSRHDKVIWFILLQHEPHAFNIVLGISPVPQGIQIAQIQLFLQALSYAAGGQSYLSGDEGLAPPFRLVVEKNSVAAIHTVALPIVPYNPIAVHLRHRIGRSGIEGGRLLLGNLLHKPEKLGSGGLINTAALIQTKKMDSL